VGFTHHSIAICNSTATSSLSPIQFSIIPSVRTEIDTWHNVREDKSVQEYMCTCTGGHTGECLPVAFSPDGRRLVSGSNDLYRRDYGGHNWVLCASWRATAILSTRLRTRLMDLIAQLWDQTSESGCRHRCASRHVYWNSGLPSAHRIFKPMSCIGPGDESGTGPYLSRTPLKDRQNAESAEGAVRGVY